MHACQCAAGSHPVAQRSSTPSPLAGGAAPSGGVLTTSSAPAPQHAAASHNQAPCQRSRCENRHVSRSRGGRKSWSTVCRRGRYPRPLGPLGARCGRARSRGAAGGTWEATLRRLLPRRAAESGPGVAFRPNFARGHTVVHVTPRAPRNGQHKPHNQPATNMAPSPFSLSVPHLQHACRDGARRGASCFVLQPRGTPRRRTCGGVCVRATWRAAPQLQGVTSSFSNAHADAARGARARRPSRRNTHRSPQRASRREDGGLPRRGAARAVRVRVLRA